MLAILIFTALSNLCALIIVSLSYFVLPFMQSVKPIDAMFLVGIFFWAISTVVRLSAKRVKKEWNRNEVIVTDPQIVIRSSSWAFKLLIAGIPGILGSIVWGTFFY